MNWYAASPSALYLSGGNGEYISTASLGYVNVSMTSANPQVADTLTFSTISNTCVSGSLSDSDNYLQIASANITGGCGIWHRLMPYHSPITVVASVGAYNFYVYDASGFSPGDGVVIMQATGFTNYQLSTIDTVNINTGHVTIVDALTSTLEVGDEVYTAPVSLGDLDPFGLGTYYKPFWVQVSAPEGTSYGLRAVRVQAWEGIINNAS